MELRSSVGWGVTEISDMGSVKASSCVLKICMASCTCFDGGRSRSDPKGCSVVIGRA